jgi:hypothetical protein
LPQDRFSSNLWKPLVRILEFILKHTNTISIFVFFCFFSVLLHFLQTKKRPLLKLHSAVSLCAPDLLTQILFKLVEAVGEHDFQEYPWSTPTMAALLLQHPEL